MYLRTIKFRGYSIDVWRFATGVYYYPSFNGNAEFTSYKDCCSYIRRCDRQSKEFEEVTSFSFWQVLNLINL